ncbi:MAG: tRNA (N(6)-L-threonylcarbamoyladenosine(37)-C(2))-methylthiotransferase MtaB [Acutalibacteraceae bacterium]|nr:tRNA (N(6)-L-threonylcarbamoyladenosine(37)-C(2))-methylthiotransferase MtaB [Acutalibacteraceae bacterium]
MKVKFYTLGCKVNQYESQAMAEQLIKHGYEVVSGKEKADVFVVNSCTVTAAADQKTRQAVRRFKRNNPGSTVVLTGCVPQAYPEKAKELIEADIVIGNKNNQVLYDVLEEYFRKGCRVFEVSGHQKGDAFCGDTITSFDERTRAYIKIQDGCNRFCSYCVIPYSRGRVRSKPIEEIRREITVLSEKGYKEVVLVGINLSSYGSDIGKSFPEAVKAANDVDGIVRVRLGSLEPDHLTDEVIEKLSECEKLCPQFHISLQSGCDKTLRSMNRHYTAEEYRHLCRKLRETFRDCTLTTDIMVGFAGENDEDFKESLSFMEEIGFEKVHVFPYSVRKGTRAEKLPYHNEKSVKEERARKMIHKAEEIRREFMKKQIGRTVSVIFEAKTEDGFLTGHTANYTPVKAKLPEKYQGELTEVEIVDVEGEYCVGIRN